jgi:hypothetical protein
VLLRRVRRAGGVCATAALLLALASCGSSGLPTSGTFTLAWTSYSSLTKPLPFTGTVAGLPVTGSAENPASFVKPLLPYGTSHLPKVLQVARWTGRLESTPFALSVSVTGLGSQSTGFNLSQISYRATGTYGSDRVNATLTPPTTNGSSTVHFVGTIGRRRVAGTVTIPQARENKGTATGTFTLTG